MNRRKVVHVITRLDFGGAQQNTLWTTQNLDPKKWEVILICGKGGFLESAGIEASQKSGFRLFFIPSLRREINPFYDLIACVRLILFFLKEKPDLVHTHSSKAGILGRIAAWVAGVKIIVHTYHGFGFHDRQNSLVKKIYVILERFCARVSAALVFVSRANWNYAFQNGIGPESRFHLIRSGVDLSRFPAVVKDPGLKKKELGFGVDNPLIISIGNLKPQKNPSDFLELAAEILKNFPEARFLFIGDGPLRADVQRQIAGLGLDQKIKLLGWRKDAAEWLSVADVFVLTSLWEGLPRSLVEAMKSGLPCVAYAVDGICDLIQDGENGYLAPIKNVKVLSEKVSLLLKNSILRENMARRATASITEEFDITGMVNAQERLYLELLNATSRA